MKKPYGGSETFIGILSRFSRHVHTVGFAKGASPPQKTVEAQTRCDFEGYIHRLPNADVYVCHFLFPATLMRERKNIVLVSHCLLSKEFELAQLDTGTTNDYHQLQEMEQSSLELEKEFYPCIPHIAVLSKFHRQELENLGCSDLAHFPLPLDIEIYTRQTTRRNGDQFRIAYLGRPTGLKGLHVLLQAAAMIPKTIQFQVRGDIIGEGGMVAYTPAVNAKGQSAMTFLPLPPNVSIAPAIPQEEVPSFLATMDALVCPSLYESIGYVNLEALASGIPVIASDIDGIRQIVKNEQNGLLFTKGDPSALADACNLLWKDPELYQSLQINSRPSVREHNAKNVVPLIDTYLESVVGK